MRTIIVVLVAAAFLFPALSVQGMNELPAHQAMGIPMAKVQGNLTANTTQNSTLRNPNGSPGFNPTTIYSYIIANSTDVLGYQAYAGYHDGGNATMPVDMIAIVHSPGPSTLTIRENGTLIISNLHFSNRTSYSFGSPSLGRQTVIIEVNNTEGNMTKTTSLSMHILTTTNFIDYEYYQHKRQYSNPWTLAGYITLGFFIFFSLLFVFFIFRYQRWERTRNIKDMEDYEEGMGVFNR